MTRFVITDPGTAAHSAKNKHAAPGLPNQSRNHSERNPMVGTRTAETTLYAPVMELMHQRPGAAAPEEDRANWLFRMADALDEVGLSTEAEDAREAAMAIVRQAIETISGGVL